MKHTETEEELLDQAPELEAGYDGDEEHASAMKEARESVSEREEAVEALRKFTNENYDDDSEEFSLRSILGGDILAHPFFIKQVLFVGFAVVLMLIYTGNRYSSQQDAILIDSLRQELQNVKYNVMTQSSVLLNMTRQSSIEKKLREQGDSTLTNPITPPYLIRKNGVNEEPLIQEIENDPNLPTGDEV